MCSRSPTNVWWMLWMPVLTAANVILSFARLSIAVFRKVLQRIREIKKIFIDKIYVLQHRFQRICVCMGVSFWSKSSHHSTVTPKRSRNAPNLCKNITKLSQNHPKWSRRRAKCFTKIASKGFKIHLQPNKMSIVNTTNLQRIYMCMAIRFWTENSHRRFRKSMLACSEHHPTVIPKSSQNVPGWDKKNRNLSQIL